MELKSNYKLEKDKHGNRWLYFKLVRVGGVIEMASIYVGSENFYNGWCSCCGVQYGTLDLYKAPVLSVEDQRDGYTVILDKKGHRFKMKTKELKKRRN